MARVALAGCFCLAAAMAAHASAKAPARAGQQSKPATQQNKNSVLPSNVRR
jgi:hypothetical protein